MPNNMIYHKIKKQNGEVFAKALRQTDSGLFDIPDLPHILQYAGREVSKELLDYLEFLKMKQSGLFETSSKDIVPKDPIELLNDAGYDAYIADTLQKQNHIRIYFAPGEELCTFKRAERYKDYYIINAVKKNVDEIKRSDFPHPYREDAYGTSVISIQIHKSGGFISIKNRYNHTVSNPDNTFGSNPDKIISGLTAAIKNRFHVDFAPHQDLLCDKYILAGNQIVKYQFECEDTYFGENCYVSDGKITKINTDSQLLFNHFLLDMHTKNITDLTAMDMTTAIVITNEIKEKKLQLIRSSDGHKHLLADDKQILEIENGKLVSLHLPTTRQIGWLFMSEDLFLRQFSAPQLERLDDYCFSYNNTLIKFDTPKLKYVGYAFLERNMCLTYFKSQQLDSPNIEAILRYHPNRQNLLVSSQITHVNTSKVSQHIHN